MLTNEEIMGDIVFHARRIIRENDNPKPWSKESITESAEWVIRLITEMKENQ